VHADGKVSFYGVHHLALNTDDMKMTVDFYVGVLGMRLVHAMKVPPGLGSGPGNRGNPPFEEIRHYFFDMGRDGLLAGMPALFSVAETINEPRYPAFKGIMAAKKKPVDTLDLAGASIDPAQTGSAGSLTKVLDASVAPPRAKGVIVSDEGEGGKQLAEFLASKKFI